MPDAEPGAASSSASSPGVAPSDAGQPADPAPRDFPDGVSALIVAAPVPPPVIRRGRRRATTQPVPGSDPSPAPEAPRHTLTENDARLNAEKPPHY